MNTYIIYLKSGKLLLLFLSLLSTFVDEYCTNGEKRTKPVMFPFGYIAITLLLILHMFNLRI